MSPSLLDTENRPAALPAAPAAPRCLNCGAALTGPFCASCGQHEVDLAAPTVEVVRESLTEAFDVDGRVLRTARALFVPGLLTTEHQHGRRMPYIGPLKLFFVAGAVLSTTWVLTRGIDAHFYGFKSYGLAAEYIQAVIRGLLGGSVAIAGGSWALSLGKRRVIDEAVFALHAMSALALLASAAIWVGTIFKTVFGTVAAVPHWLPSLPLLVFAPAALLGVAYFVLAVRRVHGGRWWRTALESLVLGALCMASVLAAIRYLA